MITALLAVGVVMAQPKKTETATFSVSMTCAKCKAAIEKNIPFEKGVKDLKVDLPKKEVTVEYDSSKTSPEKLVKAFEKINFKAKQVK